ncbi:hypothetical protein BDV10DRAFT_188497 [Aspergillus recurvatus]
MPDPIPLAQHLRILTAPRNPGEPGHWVVLYGPSYYANGKEYYTFIDIVAGPTGFSCVSRTGEMESSFMVVPWKSKRTINVPETLAVGHDEVKKAVADAISERDRSWLDVLLDVVVFWGWINIDLKRELEREIPVKPSLKGLGIWLVHEGEGEQGREK